MRKMYRDLVDKNIITFTTDSNYLPFAKILINSILQNTPSVEILGRFVNCSDEQLDTVNGIHIYRDNKELSTKRDLLTKQHLYATDDFVRSQFENLDAEREKAVLNAVKYVCSYQNCSCNDNLGKNFNLFFYSFIFFQ